MKIFNWLPTVLVACFAGIGFSNPASATSVQTFVSRSGSDTAACTATAPCATFAGAYTKTTAGGEIVCIDAGSFGPLNITSALTIKCDGVSNGGILYTSNSSGAITVNAGANDKVVLSGLDFEGGGTGYEAILYNSGASLSVVNCSIRDFSYGITVFSYGPPNLYIDNCSITSTANQAIYYSPTTSNPVTLNINNSTFKQNTASNAAAVFIEGNGTTGKITGSITNTRISGNTGYGVYIQNGASTSIAILLENDTIIGNGAVGLYTTGTGAGLLVKNSSILDNQGGGISPNGGGVIYSYGNNAVNGNNMLDGSFTGTLAQK